MSYHYFPVDPHSRHHKTKLPVTVRTLVQVHKVHIYTGPGDITVELRMQVQ
jgi:hypothetical protein